MHCISERVPSAPELLMLSAPIDAPVRIPSRKRWSERAELRWDAGRAGKTHQGESDNGAAHAWIGDGRAVS